MFDWRHLQPPFAIAAGALYSSGARSNGQLGRRITEVPAVRFGRIGIDDPVIAVAAGESHVLAMTKTKVRRDIRT